MAANPFARVLEALHDNGVRYVVAGGFAAVMHGCNRFTADLDLIIDLEQGHAETVVRLLTSLGLQPRLPVDPYDFADAATRERWVREKNMRAFTFLDPATPTFAVDLFIDLPERFEALLAKSMVIQFEDFPVRICSLDDLIRMKRAAGRPQDELDIEALEVIRDQKASS